jgi:hypothetical protein
MTTDDEFLPGTAVLVVLAGEVYLGDVWERWCTNQWRDGQWRFRGSATIMAGSVAESAAGASGGGLSVVSLTLTLTLKYNNCR